MADPHRRHTLRKSQLIDFPNVAAGHDGVKSSRSGDLIVKPCKNSEVAFYQSSWKPDPDPTEFAYYIPKFFGTLNLQDNAPQTQASQLASMQPRPGTAGSTSSSRGAHARAASRTVISHLPVDESLAPTKPPKKWEPSKGAPIDAENAVVLENVASGLVKPNILDIKLGARLWADDAPMDKRAHLDQVAAATTSGPLGFRIAGMKIWAGDGAYEASNREAMDWDRGGRTQQAAHGLRAADADAVDAYSIPRPSLREDDYASYEKDYGRALRVENVRKGFEEYFYRPPATGVRKDQAREVIARFVEDLKGLQVVMERQETRMYSASLLFVYEGSGAALRENFRRENRMIREAREQAELAILADPEVSVQSHPRARPSTSTQTGTSNSVHTQSTGSVIVPTMVQTRGALPSLPQIDLGSPLEIPLPLVMTDVDATAAGQEESEESDEEDERNKLPKIQALRVIDFAHANWTPSQGPDENFLMGVRNVIKILEDMLDGDQ